MPKRRARRWETHDENDPLAGLVNLFDLWMVFSIALLIVFAGSTRRPHAPNAKTPANDAARPVDEFRVQSITQYRVSRETLQGSGERLGTAYRLPSGEVVCVPDASPTDDSSPRTSSSAR